MTKKVKPPTEQQYSKIARMAQEFNQTVALASLTPLLERESDYSRTGQLGQWFWECGHFRLAEAAYRRSIEIMPDKAIYFNLAICLDDQARDMEDRGYDEPEPLAELFNQAVDALVSFYRIVDNESERTFIENMLRQNGKEHLIEPARKKLDKGISQDR